MPRNFESWLEAYEAYSDDSFVPKEFNTWCGISALAGALERKVWLPWSDTFSYYPNVFVLLVAKPGVGKSTALNKSVGLLQKLNERTNDIHLIPSQVTEAKFIELMGSKRIFQMGTQVHSHSSGYYFASEASNSLRNIYGDFLACLTDFYDCPPYWEKATLKDDKITLRNLCLNLIAGSTFEYLSRLVTAEQVMGGFASRLIYVVCNEQLVRDQDFQAGISEEKKQRKADFRKRLIDDLQDIHSMAGPFTGTPEYGEAWKEWYQRFEKERAAIPSERLQSLMARVNTNMMKLSMIISASEGGDRVLRFRHWEKALGIMEPIIAALPGIFQEARSQDTKSQDGLTQAIVRLCSNSQGKDVNALKAKLNMIGFNPNRIDTALNYMIQTGLLKRSNTGSSSVFQLTKDPSNYL